MQKHLIPDSARLLMPRGDTLLLTLLLLDDDEFNPPTEAQAALPSRCWTPQLI